LFGETTSLRNIWRKHRPAKQHSICDQITTRSLHRRERRGRKNDVTTEAPVRAPFFASRDSSRERPT
jgi:hypothetical protein